MAELIAMKGLHNSVLEVLFKYKLNYTYVF